MTCKHTSMLKLVEITRAETGGMTILETIKKLSHTILSSFIVSKVKVLKLICVNQIIFTSERCSGKDVADSVEHP